MRTAAILPVKRFDAAKQRLDGALSRGARRALAEAMVTDVLTALRRSRLVDEVVVVSDEPVAEAIARGYDARVIHEGGDLGHSAAAEKGLEALDPRVERVLLVPGDCPALMPAEVDALLDRPAVPGGEVVVVPDRHGTGTNALVLAPPRAIRPGFGPGSRARHVERAGEAGVACAIVEPWSFVLDVDDGDDLAALREALATSRGGAAHTRGLLGRL